MKEYKNQVAIDMLRAKVDSVCPGLRVSRLSFNGDEDTVFSAAVVLPIKGNKKIIDELMKIGFVQERREMVRGQNMFEKDIFLVWLTINLREFSEMHGRDSTKRL